MKTIETTCVTCGALFHKPKNEHTRSLKIGRKFYCNKTCAGKASTAITAYKGQGNIGIYCMNRVDAYTGFREYARRARHRGKEFNVSLEYLSSVWDKQEGKCAYTGIKLVHQVANTHGSIYTASIDRIDSSIGYVEGNIQFVTTHVNFMKSTLTHDEMVLLIKEVRSNN